MASDPSISAQPYFVDQWRKIAYRLRISSKSKLIILALIDQYARHKDGLSCYPSIESIAWDTCLSERTVQRCFDELGKAGIVHRVENPGTSNDYTFSDPDTFADLMPERPRRKKLGRLSGTPDIVTPQPRQDVTPPPPTCHPTPVRLSPDHSDLSPALNTPREQEAAVTHTREGERACEASQPAAAKGQDLDFDHEQPKQAAASSEPTPAPTVQAGAELEGWFSDQLKERRAELVVKPEPITPRQVKACLRAILAHAAGDEAQVKAYLTERMDHYAMRGDAAPRSCKALLGFLADRGDWVKWEGERREAVARPPGNMRAHGGKRHGALLLFDQNMAAVAAKIDRN